LREPEHQTAGLGGGLKDRKGEPGIAAIGRKVVEIILQDYDIVRKQERVEYGIPCVFDFFSCESLRPPRPPRGSFVVYRRCNPSNSSFEISCTSKLLRGNPVTSLAAASAATGL
jgi:hypothetical protein